jgi:type I restriction enzyme S subunit
MMNETWINNLNVIANSPKGVEQLRVLILRLAFSGRLSHSRSTARDRHTSWESRSIESICSEITPGFACSKKEQASNGHVHLRTHNISTIGSLNRDLMIRINPKMVDPSKASIQKGDILFNNTNSQELVGKSAIIDNDYEYGFSNHITRLRVIPGIDPTFVTLYLTFLRNTGYFASICTRWINQAAINGRLLKLQIVPVPPLEEQKRIVAKVDEMMRLCDRLEAQQQEREKLLPLLSRANHTRFVTERSHSSLQSVFQNPGTVFADDLRQTVLSLAVRGSLVPQVASDGTADDLISEISQSKTRLLEANTIPTPSKLPPIDVNEVPFDLPKGWRWIRLESVCELITKGSSPKWQGVNYVTIPVDGVMFITSENVGNYRLRKMDEPKFVEAKFNEMEKRSILHRDDILINLVGASIGRSAIWDRDDLANINQAVGIIRLVRGPRAINRRYLLHYLNSPTCLNIMFLNQVETARANISLTNVKEFLVPIPPESEQQRIATTVERVFNWISQLEEQQQAREIVSTKFAKAAIDAITSTEFTEIERMKPPKTEIVTALKIASKPQKADVAPLAVLLSEQDGVSTAKSLWKYSGLEIDAFYRQLKTEITNGWIEEDTSKRSVKEVEVG